MNLQGPVRYGGEGRGKQGKQKTKLSKRNREKQIYFSGMNWGILPHAFFRHVWSSVVAIMISCHHTYVIFLWFSTFQGFHWGCNESFYVWECAMPNSGNNLIKLFAMVHFASQGGHFSVFLFQFNSIQFSVFSLILHYFAWLTKKVI